jgi:hypothetical protein
LEDAPSDGAAHTPKASIPDIKSVKAAVNPAPPIIVRKFQKASFWQLDRFARVPSLRVDHSHCDAGRTWRIIPENVRRRSSIPLVGVRRLCGDLIPARPS